MKELREDRSLAGMSGRRLLVLFVVTQIVPWLALGVILADYRIAAAALLPVVGISIAAIIRWVVPE